jgi:hypothetical protein
LNRRIIKEDKMSDNTFGNRVAMRFLKIVLVTALSILAYNLIIGCWIYYSVHSTIKNERDRIANIIYVDNCISEVNYSMITKDLSIDKSDSNWLTYGTINFNSTSISTWDESATTGIPIVVRTYNSGTLGSVNLFGYATAPQQSTQIYVAVKGIANIPLLYLNKTLKVPITSHIVVTGSRFYKNPKVY